MTRNAILLSAALVALTANAQAGELPYGMDAYVGAFGGYGYQHRAPPLASRSYSVETSICPARSMAHTLA